MAILHNFFSLKAFCRPDALTFFDDDAINCCWACLVRALSGQTEQAY